VKEDTRINLASKRTEYASLITLLLVALMMRLFLFQIQGYKEDLNFYISWLQTAADSGLKLFYNNIECDYPPFNVYLFLLFGYLAKSLSLFGSNQITFIVKLIPSLFDIATVYLIFVFVRARSNLNVSLIAAAAYAFNPAVIFTSSIWGQFDSIYTFFLLLSFVLIFSSKLSLSVSTFTLAVLSKPQSIALAPLMALLIYKKYGLRGILTSSIIIAGTTILVILPFQWDNPITFLKEIYLLGYGRFPYTSVNAFNFWGLFGMWNPDTQGILFFNPYILGWIMFIVVTFYTLDVVDERMSSSGEKLVFFSAFILLFSFFMLPTRIHERYSFPSLSFLAVMIPFLSRVRVIYGVVSVTLLINLAYVMMRLNSLTPILDGDPVVFCVSLANTFLLGYGLVLLWREIKEMESPRRLSLS
jgi:Gpi18-like mannosyltransferase